MQFSFKQYIKVSKLLQDQSIANKIYGVLLSYMPHYHGRIDNNSQHLKMFLNEYLHGKSVCSLNLNEEGSVRLEQQTNGFITITIKTSHDQLFYMEEAEALELIQGIVVKLILGIDETKYELQNYFRDSTLHSSSAVLVNEAEEKIEALTTALNELATTNTKLNLSLEANKRKCTTLENELRTVKNETSRCQEYIKLRKEESQTKLPKRDSVTHTLQDVTNYDLKHAVKTKQTKGIAFVSNTKSYNEYMKKYYSSKDKQQNSKEVKN